MLTMSLETARQTIQDYRNNGAEEDTSHLRAGEYESVIVMACNVLEEIGNGFDRACAEHIAATAPSIFDWDSYGNWVGNVSNENGWAA